MQELRSEEIGDRKVALVEQGEGWFAVTIAVYGPSGEWEDISLCADRPLAFEIAIRRYRVRIAEQQQSLAFG